MKEIIAVRPSSINGQQANTVNARELHEFLQVGKDFSTWIKDRIRQYGFAENQDFILTFPKIGERRNVKITEYHLTLDMAKELSMVERNARGKQARRYFIECERRVLEVARLPSPAVPKHLSEKISRLAGSIEWMLGATNLTMKNLNAALTEAGYDLELNQPEHRPELPTAPCHKPAPAIKAPSTKDKPRTTAVGLRALAKLEGMRMRDMAQTLIHIKLAHRTKSRELRPTAEAWNKRACTTNKKGSFCWYPGLVRSLIAGKKVVFQPETERPARGFSGCRCAKLCKI